MARAGEVSQNGGLTVAERRRRGFGVAWKLAKKLARAREVYSDSVCVLLAYCLRTACEAGCRHALLESKICLGSFHLLDSGLRALEQSLLAWSSSLVFLKHWSALKGEGIPRTKMSTSLRTQLPSSFCVR